MRMLCFCIFILSFVSFVLLKGGQNKYLVLFKRADYIFHYDGKFITQNSYINEWEQIGWRIKESKLIRLTVLTLKIDKLYLCISFTANTYPLYKYIFLLSFLCSWLMNVKNKNNKKPSPTQESRGLHHLQDYNIRNKWVAWLLLMLMLKNCMSSNHLNYKWNGSNWQRQTCTQADRNSWEWNRKKLVKGKHIFK